MREEIIKTFEKVYTSEADAIFRFCFTKVSDRQQALDITQETFLRLWQSLLEEKEIMNNRAFLFTVARRLVIDWYRKKKSISLESMSSGENGEIDYDISDEMITSRLLLGAEGRYLLDKINELTSVNREAVYLRFVEDLSPPEIGEILGISANAASVRINRGLMELREKVGYNNDTE
ncbi:MAG: RNA polymerase sigma factor [Candidatus Paceibacterota bacterium]|jgi:RNA polymerase sigma-70 factor (ECF subfamily)